MKNFFLATTSLDQFLNYKKKKLYLGHYCLSSKDKVSEFQKVSIVQNHWGDKKKIIKKHKNLKKIISKLFSFLVKKLNFIHGRNENKSYWKIIIYPWVCYYTTTLYDRWETISALKKKINKSSFVVNEYEIKDKSKEIEDMQDWFNKYQMDIFNNILFNKILKVRKFDNIKITSKKYHHSINKKNKFFFKLNFLKIIDKFLAKIGLRYNSIYFDKFILPRFFFINLCVKNFQIPTNNISTFENIDFGTSYNFKIREKLTKKIINQSDFERFLFNELKYQLPKSYLENYDLFINSRKKFFKKKKTIFGMYSAHINDYFKIFLAESKIFGSRYIHSRHGAGLHSSHDALYNHFEDISEKVLKFTKSTKPLKKEIYLGSSIYTTTKKPINKKNKKLLINFHEFVKYSFRAPVTVGPFNENVEEFDNLTRSLKNLDKKIMKNLKFRPKEINQLNCQKRFSDIFGSHYIEKTSEINYTDSIEESKLIICSVPQTSYTECLLKNIPTILVGNKEAFFDTPERIKFLKKLKSNNFYFNDMYTAIKFINKNWENIYTWWSLKKTQDIRKLYLSKYCMVDKNYKNRWKSFVKKEINQLVSN